MPCKYRLEGKLVENVPKTGCKFLGTKGARALQSIGRAIFTITNQEKDFHNDAWPRKIERMMPIMLHPMGDHRDQHLASPERLPRRIR